MRIYFDREKMHVELDYNDSAYLSFILRVGIESVKQLDNCRVGVMSLVLDSACKIGSKLAKALDEWRYTYDPIYFKSS